ncbi:MAG: hypothetical protein WCR58_06065 [Bacteroidales bacterium]|jgi:hypothetical protein|nr:hypothetical protein [Bacteroidales bacterium]MCK9447573.1 hypothetical protein [Bacteroidales bacterium]MDY0369238.1 hypothetical protein [Bacteroidales bacterium]
MTFIQWLPTLIVFVVMLGLLFAFLRKDELISNKSISNQQSDTNKESDSLGQQIRLEHYRLMLPFRIQATERLLLLLERMQVRLLINRHLSGSLTAQNLAQLMITNIRDEFEHNLTQQLFVSETVWQLVVASKEEVIQQIHLALAGMEESAGAHELAQKLLFAEPSAMITQAMRLIKNELKAPE